MDRVFIKPTSREILIKDSNKEGYLDIYSYDYHSDDNKRGLGSLYIIGNVNQATETSPEDTPSQDPPDVAYMINLVASLAKREYYSNTELTPKEAFGATLKKINEIVDEFFKNRGTKINVGMFAVAGEDILISKLGKFKIILNRDNQAIDILNNITLFSKEHVQEKEFSNIISGKIKSGDKLFAYYPSRFITSREKVIKDHFLKLTWSDFVEKINTIRSTKTDAACAALYIDLNKVKESAIKPKSEEVPIDEVNRGSSIRIPRIGTTLVSADNRSGAQETSTALDIKEPELPPGDVHDHEKEPQPEIKQEMPRIIPSEFSSAKKQSIFDKLLSWVKSFKRKDSLGHIGGLPGQGRPRWRLGGKKLAYALPVLIVVLAGGFLAKQYFFVSAEVKESRKLTNEIKQNIKLAKDKIGSDPGAARQMLLASLVRSSSKDLNDQVLELLDKADNAVLVNPALVDGLPEEVKKRSETLNSLPQAMAMDLYEDNLYSLTESQIFKTIDAAKGGKNSVAWLKDGVSLQPGSIKIAIDGNVFVLTKSGAIVKYYKGDKVNEFNTSIVGDDIEFLTAKDLPSFYLINKKLGRIYVVDKESGSFVKVVKLGNSEPFTNAYLDSKGVVYLTSSDNKIWKVE